MKIKPFPILTPFYIFFIRFKSIDELDFFYNSRFQIWLYYHSHEKKQAGKYWTGVFEHDENGYLIDVRFSGTTRDGILLTEKDFLKYEFELLETVACSQLTFDEYKRVEYYRDFLQKKMKVDAGEIRNLNPKEKSNPYPEVFKSLDAFSLFERLFHNKKDSSTVLADFSFIYRSLEKDNLLQDHQKPEVFRQWLSKEPYNVVLDNKFKTLDNCTTKAKEDSYLDAKHLIQKQPE